MKAYSPILSLLFAGFFLSSCTNDTNSTFLELNTPVSTRMNLIDLQDWEYQVDIIVNSGALQTFRFDSDETNLSVVIAGIQANEQNSIEIFWQAIIDGESVELSQQSQVFFADGNTIIDAPHAHDQFDFDGDGASNVFELAAGTCVWAVTEPCIHPNPTDTDTNNILLNGNFNNGTDHWWSTLSRAEVADGELCMTVQPSDTIGDFWHLGQLNRFPLEKNTSYSLSFFARSQTLAEMTVSVTLPELDFLEAFVTNVEVFTTFNQYSYQFNTTNRDYEQTTFVINISPDMNNVFCLDDVVLEKVDNE